MKSGGQPISGDSEASRLADLQPRPATSETMANAGWHGSHEIQIDEGNRVFVEPISDGLGVRVGLIASGLIAIGGVAWLIGGLPSPFSSTLVGELRKTLNSLPQLVRQQKEEHRAVHNLDKPETAPVPNEVASRVAKHSADAPKHLASLPRHLMGAHQQKAAAAKAPRIYNREKLEPVPETRPTTIKGWTLHEVIGGTVVLQGPNGTFRAVRGNKVPGVGRIYSIFRWGNRLMVATSRGLISTP